MNFYMWRQNNTGGSFITDGDLSRFVVIEAESYDKAEEKALNLGIYYNGVDSDRDCACCGDRWYEGDLVEIEDGDTIEAGVFNVEAIPDESFAAVPPRTSFSVDVAGCLELDPKACEDEAGFVGRGCAGPFSRERDTELAITVELLPTAEGNAVCPVAP